MSSTLQRLDQDNKYRLAHAIISVMRIGVELNNVAMENAKALKEFRQRIQVEIQSNELDLVP